MNSSNVAFVGLSRKIEALKPAAGTVTNIGCLAFPAVFLIGTTAVENTQTGYNRIADTISELVWGTSGWVENVLFLAFAIALSMFALRMRAAFIPLMAAALGFIIIAIFPTQWSGDGPTLQSTIHQYSAQGIALALPVACFCLAQKLQSREETRFIATCSLTAGAIGIILNLAGFLAVYGQTGWVGGAERLVMLNGLIWLQLVSIHLWLLGRKPSTACCNSDDRTASFANLVVHQTPQIFEVKVSSEQDKFGYRR